MRLAILLLMMLFCASVAPATAQTSMARGFEKFEIQTANRPWGYARVEFSDGRRAERFELRAGDCPVETRDCDRDRERIEFAERPPGQRKGIDYWYAWSVYLPSDFPRNGPINIKLGQFHQRGDSGPELLFQFYDRGLAVELSDPVRRDSDPMKPIPPLVEWPLTDRATMMGRWTRVMLNARRSTGADGYLRIWINGAQKVSYDGPTTNDAVGVVYFKYGLYRSFMLREGIKTPPTLIAYYADVRRGRSRDAVE